MSETYLEYVWVDFTRRTITIMDDEGRQEKVRYKWDEEGALGFQSVVEMIQEDVPSERCHFKL
tara:strand:+ start:2966 stop:3154 length:189 start_codon:yes stop_codon:yes gene_type:complete